MNLFGVTEAHAMAINGAAQQGGKPGYEGLIMLALMFAIFYFLLIRPQQKRAKQHRQLVEALKVGDSVVTAGGIHGKVAAIQESVVTLEVSTGVKIKINRSSIVSTKQEQ
ncbi:MAG TPA: preprotein translocase subunit YajC [Desulfuromonadales bacterium]|nr:preprotein translocase subunit YajC [Desulfuromonadales bacterium]